MQFLNKTKILNTNVSFSSKSDKLNYLYVSKESSMLLEQYDRNFNEGYGMLYRKKVTAFWRTVADSAGC